MHRKLAHPDELVARIAARQHGVVSLAQLDRAGLSPDAVRHRVRTGRLHRIHRGVYALGRPQLGRRGGWKAATLALGDGAVLSHRSAAELWRLLEPRAGPIHVTVGRGGRAGRPAIRLHRSTMPAGATTSRDGIAVTTPRRTLADLRREISAAELRDAIRAAERAGLPIGDYAALIRGTRSELEFLLLELIRRHRLPEPEVNVRVDRFLVDFLWRRRRLVVETDGRRFHRGALATAADLARDARLRSLGFDVLRLTYRQVVNRPLDVIAQLRRRLAPA